MPSDGDIDVLKVAGAYHEDLGRTAFLGWTAIVAHPSLAAFAAPNSSSPRSPPARPPPPACCDRSHARGRRRPAPFGSAMPATCDRPGRASYSPRTAITGPPSPASPMMAVGMPATFSVIRNPSCSSMAQCSATERILGIANLRHLPDAVGQSLIGVFARIDELPDLVAVLHRHPPVAAEPRPAGARSKSKSALLLPDQPRTRPFATSQSDPAVTSPRPAVNGARTLAPNGHGQASIIDRTRSGLPSSRVWQTRRRAAAPRLGKKLIELRRLDGGCTQHSVRLAAMMHLMLEKMHQQPIGALDLHIIAALHAAATAQGLLGQRLAKCDQSGDRRAPARAVRSARVAPGNWLLQAAGPRLPPSRAST